MSHSDEQLLAASLAAAESWTKAVRDGDVGALESLLADDLVTWRNVTRTTQPRSELIETALSLSQGLPGFHYAGIRRRVFADGFVQQHLIRGQGPSGESFAVPACIICAVRAGRITKIEEYYDSAQDPR